MVEIEKNYHNDLDVTIIDAININNNSASPKIN
jgi:hypothetical protein